MFKVPNEYRIRTHPVLGSDDSVGNYGAFQFFSTIDPSCSIMCIASAGDDDGWEHVSVSVRRSTNKGRMPNWYEMCQVKSIFWDDEDCVIQFHPPKSVYVNTHPGVLHLWRQVGINLPTPPEELIG